jgi:phosphatidylglycerol lysyltransferase
VLNNKTEDQQQPWLPPEVFRRLSTAGIIVLALIVAFVLRQQLAAVNYQDIVRDISAVSTDRLWLAIAGTAASFMVLSVFDFTSLAYLKLRVPFRLVLATSFTAFAVGNFLGFGMLTGGAIRARAYNSAGLDAKAIAQVISLNAGAYGLAIMCCSTLALWFSLFHPEVVLPGPAGLATLITALLSVATLGLALVLLTPLRRVAMQRWKFALPTPTQSLGYLLGGIVDMLLSALVLWSLLPLNSIDYSSFAALYFLATALGLLSHLPGGVGVFETVMLLGLGGANQSSGVAGALVLYRLIYYLLPVLVASGLVAWQSFLSQYWQPFRRFSNSIAPTFLALLSSLLGIILLLSGVTPMQPDIEQRLRGSLPLFIVEASHFFGSIAGLALLLITRSLLHRQHAAWLVAFVSTLLTIVMALPRKIAWIDLGVALLFAAYLFQCRHMFNRRSTLLNASLTPGWWIYVSAVLGCCLWLLFFAYQDVAYTDQLWWQFAFDNSAPRSLRALMAVTILTLLLGLWQLLRTPDTHILGATKDEVAQAVVIAQQHPNADALLVAMADKCVMLSANSQAFLMYSKVGRAWIALFDPIGPEADRIELIWTFVEHAEQHGGRAAFYEARGDLLPHYLDAGMRIYKVGECAIVELPEFSLEGPKRSKLRQTVNRAERDGLSFEILSADGFNQHYPALKTISTAWLDSHNTREKSFSLGNFSYDYLAQQPIAVVHFGGAIVAFASLQMPQHKGEVSLDLMRYLDGAPKSCMEYLFCQLLLHCKAQGYQRFSLGMAPMAGMSQHRLTSHWHKLAHFIYSHGERFYNFQGLRAFKNKFDPEWEPRYLVTTPGYLPILALTDIALLVSGGLKGVISK